MPQPSDGEAVENFDPRGPSVLTAEKARQNGIGAGTPKPGEYPETLHTFIDFPNGSPAKRFGFLAMTASWGQYLRGDLPAKIGNDEQLPMATTWENSSPPERLTGAALATPLVSVSPTGGNTPYPASQQTIKQGLANQQARAPLSESDMLALLESGDVYSWG